VRGYSPDLISLSWYGLDLSPGLAQGSFISVTRNAPTWTQKPDGVGGVVRMFNPDTSGEVAVLIDQESAVNQDLIAIATADRFVRVAVAPLILIDNSAREIVTFSAAYPSTIPDPQRGTASTVLSWIFNFETLVQLPLDKNANRVGT
jgi:hypothetical protein